MRIRKLISIIEIMLLLWMGISYIDIIIHNSWGLTHAEVNPIYNHNWNLWVMVNNILN